MFDEYFSDMPLSRCLKVVFDVISLTGGAVLTPNTKIKYQIAQDRLQSGLTRFQMHLWELPQTQGSLKSVQKLQIFHLDTSNIKTRQTVYDYYWKLWDPGLPDPARSGRKTGSGLIVHWNRVFCDDVFIKSSLKFLRKTNPWRPVCGKDITYLHFMLISYHNSPHDTHNAHIVSTQRSLQSFVMSAVPAVTSPGPDLSII